MPRNEIERINSLVKRATLMEEKSSLGFVESSPGEYVLHFKIKEELDNNDDDQIDRDSKFFEKIRNKIYDDLENKINTIEVKVGRSDHHEAQANKGFIWIYVLILYDADEMIERFIRGTIKEV